MSIFIFDRKYAPYIAPTNKILIYAKSSATVILSTFLTNEILLTVVVNQSESEKSYQQCSRQIQENSRLWLFSMSLPHFNSAIEHLGSFVIVNLTN